VLFQLEEAEVTYHQTAEKPMTTSSNPVMQIQDARYTIHGILTRLIRTDIIGPSHNESSHRLLHVQVTRVVLEQRLLQLPLFDLLD